MPKRAEFDAFKKELHDDIAAVLAKIADLKQQLAGGIAVTDEDLAELHADLADLTGETPPPPVL